jgi:hypothetical protein
MSTLIHDRTELESLFWDGVAKLLTQKYGHDSKKALEAIDLYRRSIQLRTQGPIPEAVYNQGEDQTAEIVHGVIETGLPRLKR